MKLTHCLKDNTTLKCDSPENTIKRLTKALARLGLEFTYESQRVDRRLNLYWGRLTVPTLNIASNGKGITPELTKASALAELIERISSGLAFKRFFVPKLAINRQFSHFFGFNNFDYLEGYVHSPQEELENPLTIGELLGPRKDSFPDLQEDQHQDLFMHWVDGYSLLQQKKVKIPLKFIGLISGTNGLAAGNALEEAIVQASNEIFERYVCIKTISNNQIIPTITLESFENETIKKIIRRFHKKNIEVIIKDFSQDKLFPCIGAVFINRSLEKKSNNPIQKAFQYRTFRVGGSFNTKEALLRCFTEHMQGKTLKYFKAKKAYSRLWNYLLKHLEPNYEPPINYLGIFRKYEFAGDLSFLEQGPIIDYTTSEPIYDCLKEIEKIKEICRRLKTDIIIVNHTHPILNFPVVRVIIPKISDILPYYSLEMKENFSIKSIRSYRINNELPVSLDRYIYQSDWLQDKTELKRLTKDIIANIKRNNSYQLYTVGLLYRNIDALKLLASLYFLLDDLPKFAIVTKLLGVRYPKQRFKFLHLHLLARFGQKELLTKELKKQKGCDFYFQTEPLKNPFTTWCDKPCSEACEEKYLQTLKLVLKSFYP